MSILTGFNNFVDDNLQFATSVLIYWIPYNFQIDNDFINNFKLLKEYFFIPIPLDVIGIGASYTYTMAFNNKTVYTKQYNADNQEGVVGYEQKTLGSVYNSELSLKIPREYKYIFDSLQAIQFIDLMKKTAENDENREKTIFYQYWSKLYLSPFLILSNAGLNTDVNNNKESMQFNMSFDVASLNKLLLMQKKTNKETVNPLSYVG